MEVVAELQKKYPKRREEVCWPKVEDILKELKEAQPDSLLTRSDIQSLQKKQPNLCVRNTDVRSDCSHTESSDQNKNSTDNDQQMDIVLEETEAEMKEEEKTHSSEETTRWLEENKVHTHVTSEDIEQAVMRIKKSTGAGPQQITPWMLRQAVENSTNRSCALAIAKLSNRMAKGDFGRISGRTFSMMRSAALWKSKDKTSVRPIGIRDVLKRLWLEPTVIKRDY